MVRTFSIFILVFLLAFEWVAMTTPLAMAAEFKYVTVEADGSGGTAQSAVSSALASAVSQVNGASVAAATVTAEVRAAIDTEKESNFASASAISEGVALATKGVVQQYKILSKRQDGNIWVVTIQASVARYEKSVQADRLRLVILPLWINKEGQREFRDVFVEALGATLTQSRKFAVLDRGFEDERQGEMAINASAGTAPEEMAKLGNRLGTDYMVVGRVEEASLMTTSTEVMGRTLKNTQLKASVSYRVVDAISGQVKYANNWVYHSGASDLKQMARQGSEAVSHQILDAIFPLAVESVDGQTLFIGSGGSTVKVGQTYRIVRYGKSMTDRYTGESLGQEEIDVGTVQIVDVQAKTSKAKIVKSSVDVAASFAPGAYILRLVAEAGANMPASGKPPAASKPVEDLKKKTEGDW